MSRIIIGVILIGLAYRSEPAYFPVMFVQGMILINLGIYNWGNKTSINHL